MADLAEERIEVLDPGADLGHPHLKALPAHRRAMDDAWDRAELARQR